MNLREPKYSQFALVREMLETPGILRSFPTHDYTAPIDALKKTGRLFLTGEGSSRIFPAKNAIRYALTRNLPLWIHTEGSRQAAESDMHAFTLFGASNSGKTKEVITLLTKKNAAAQFGLTAFGGTPLANFCDKTFVLQCGKEDAVAATKSVVEQAIFYQTLLAAYAGTPIAANDLHRLGDLAQTVLEQPIDAALVQRIAAAPVIYFAGRNDGVAEEATLKTNEITRKKSAYLEGTYAVHGIEEVMDPSEVVIVVDPFQEEEQKFSDVLVRGVGMKVIAISSRETMFPTIRIPSFPPFDATLQLLACWSVLVEIGLAAGINLDKPTRARKIGNEYAGPGR